MTIHHTNPCIELDVPDMTSGPNVIVVVLDCVRYDAFERALNDPLRVPFLKYLSSQVAQYTRVVAPGSWTIPSHASLFTGMYPWDHGATYRTGVELTSDHRTIAELLSNQGYQTASFSGNGLIQPATGLTRGFMHSLWAGDREFYLRFLRQGTPSCRPLALTGAPGRSGKSTPSESSILGTIGKISSRSLALWDGLNRVGGRLGRGAEPGPPLVARWIESEMGRWIATVPVSCPIFAFVNLFDAHEPYLINGGFEVPFRQWCGSLTMRNAQERWLSGRGSPSSRYLSEFRRSYERTLDALDRRLAAIVDLLRSLGRWRDTLFVLTSDHGQSLWESGLLGHRLLVTESLTRVPLWVKFPEGRLAGSRRDAWCSLTDVPATIASVVAGKQFGDSQATSLLADERDRACRIVYSTADGITSHEARGMLPQQRVVLDRLRVAAYRGDTKVVVEAGRHATVEVPMGSGSRVRDARSDGRGVDVELESAAAEKLERLSASAGRAAADKLGRRLAAWGY